jgi:hypothetical protein
VITSKGENSHSPGASIQRISLPSRLIAITLFLWTSSNAHARPVQNWTDEQLTSEADLIVIATATSSQDEPADRRNAIPDSWVGVNTSLKPSAILKGKLDDKSNTVLHDRYFDKQMAITIVGGPEFVEFDTTGATKYLLFLKQR